MRQLVSGIKTTWSDGISEWISTFEGNNIKTAAKMTLAEGEKIIKMESKAHKLAGTERLRVLAIKLTTDKGQVWKSSDDYDTKNNDSDVSEDAPSGYHLKGFYEELHVPGNDFYMRIGPIWGNK